MSEKEKSVFEPEIPHVPAGWEVTPFQRVVLVVSDAGKRIKQRDYLVQGKIPVIDQGQDFIGGYTDDEGLAFDGNLPVVLFGDHTRAIKFVDKQFAVGAEGIKILQPASCYDPKFFYYLLTSLQIPSRGYSRHFQFLKKFHLPIAPLSQQTRIVAEIEKQFSRLDEAVANLKRVKANLKRYKAAVLKAAVEGKLTEEWRKQHPDVEPADKLLERILEERRANWQGRGKYKEPVAPDTSGLPELPEGWAWASVEQVGDVIGGLTKNPKRASLPRQLPYLRVANVYANELRLDEIEYIGVEDKELHKLLVHQDNLLIVEGNGSPDQIGRVAIWDGSIENCVHQNHLIKVRLSIDCAPKWALFWLLSANGHSFVREVSSSTSGLYTLSVGKVGGLPIPLPSLAEQHQIITEVERRLSFIADSEAQVDANLRRADCLRQSILKQAFSGQLVSQDPNDELANVLLERIRAIHNAAGKKPVVRPRKHRTPAPEAGVPSPEPAPLVAETSATYGDAIAARLLAAMQPGREYARADLVDQVGLTTGQWNAAIQELKRVGKVRQVGEKRGARYLLSLSR